MSNPGKVFRGKAITILFVDEAAHAQKIEEAYTGFAMSLSKAQMDAHKNDIPFGTIVLSTPNKKAGIGKWFYEMWSKSVNGETSYTPHKIHWREIPDFENDPTWYSKQCKILGNDPRKIAQELELAFVGTDSTLFSEEVQNVLQRKEGRDPKEKIKFRNEGELWRFRDINRTKFHLIGVDTASEAGGTDFSTIQVFEYESLHQILEFKGKLAVKRFSEVLKLCCKMCPHNLVIIENNSYGNQVIEELRFDQNHHFNIFGELRGKGKGQTFMYGLNTNMRTRPLIVDALYHYVTDNPSIIKSERLAFELLSLTDKTNRVEADEGFNDDLAFGFICYVRHYCRAAMGNTDDVYNIDEANVFEDGVSLLSNMNNPGAPLVGSFENDEYHIFKRNLEKFISENAGVGGVSGSVNTLGLFRKGNSGLFDVVAS